MTADLYWLTLTLLATALMWAVYIPNRIAVRGLIPSLGNPSPGDRSQSPWAERAILAHRNAVENLAVFAPLVLIADAAGAASETTASAAMIFFFARMAHFAIYVAGLPVLRTFAFAAGMFCQLAMALAILGLV